MSSERYLPITIHVTHYNFDIGERHVIRIVLCGKCVEFASIRSKLNKSDFVSFIVQHSVDVY